MPSEFWSSTFAASSRELRGRMRDEEVAAGFEARASRVRLHACTEVAVVVVGLVREQAVLARAPLAADAAGLDARGAGVDAAAFEHERPGRRRARAGGVRSRRPLTPAPTIATSTALTPPPTSASSSTSTRTPSGMKPAT